MQEMQWSFKRLKERIFIACGFLVSFVFTLVNTMTCFDREEKVISVIVAVSQS